MKFSKSLQLRFMLFLLGAGVLPALIITFVLITSYESQMISSEIRRLNVQVGLLSGEIITSGYLENGEAEGINAELTSVADSYAGRIMVTDEELRVVKDTYGMYDGRIFLWENAVIAMQGENTSYYDRDNSFLIITAPILSQSEENTPIHGIMMMTESTESLESGVEYVSNIGLICLIVVVLLMAALSGLVSGWLVRPLHELSSSINDLGKTNESSITSNAYSETREIAESFNHYQQMMRVLDDSRQEFVSNVSHELKTPLASIKVLADSINMMGDDAPIEMYREFMGDITTEVDRETKTINDLLSLVRMDKSKADLNITITNINELLELILKRLEPLAAKQEVELVMESFRPVTAEVDEVKFSLAIMNLIENAIKYNNAGGWVHVSINSDHQYCFIRVEDNGMGISEEAIGHVFERFYRGDKSHSREISGTGLGLAITREAILLHHGEIRVSSVQGEGTVFDVRIPLSYIEEREGR